MNMNRYLSFIAFLICISVVELKEQRNEGLSDKNVDFSFLESDPKHEDWIDPFDMFKYEPAMKNSARPSNKEDKRKDVEKSNDKTDEDTVTCDGTTECDTPSEMHKYQTEHLFSNTNKESTVCNDEEFLYLKRTASMVLNKIHALKKHSPTSELHIKLTVSQDDVGVLNDFLSSPCKYAQEIDAVISVMVNDAKLMEDVNYLVSVYSYISPFLYLENLEYYVMLFTLLIPMCFLIRGTVWQIITRLFILLFFLSFIWNWMLLTKTEIANAHAKMEKLSATECHVEKMGLHKKVFAFFTNIFSSNDRCKQYHEAVLIEPLWKVNPLMVLLKTATQLFFHPLGSLGQHLGLFFQNLFTEISWYLIAPVGVIVTIIICQLLLMAFGYRFRLPFWMGTIEPAHPPNLKSHNKLIDDVLEGRVHILRNDSAQSIGGHERPIHCLSCNNASDSAAQRTVSLADKQETENGTTEYKKERLNIEKSLCQNSHCSDELNYNKIQNSGKESDQKTSKE